MKKKRMMYLLCAMMSIMAMVSFTNITVSAKKQKVVKIKVEPSQGKKVQDYDIQSALNMASNDDGTKYIITVPKGTYTFQSQNGLHIYSNTTLNIKGCTFKKGANLAQGAFIQVGYPRKETKKVNVWGGMGTGYYWGKYDRGHDIKVIGGTFDGGTRVNNITTLCTFSHVRDITFKDTVFRYTPSKRNNAHLIECGGVKNLTLDGCKFYGNKLCGEAVQFESTYSGVAGSDLMGKTDGTKTSNVTVKNCMFSNFEYGIGTNHGCSKDVYSNMVIQNCKFSNISKYAVCVYNYKLKMSKNKLEKCRSNSWSSMILRLGGSSSVKIG